MLEKECPEKVPQQCCHRAVRACLEGALWDAFGRRLGLLVALLVRFFFSPSPWAPLGAVLAPSSTSWAVFPTVSGRSWVLLEHLGCVESRCEREMRIVRFTIVKPMILRMREPSKRVLRGLLDASVAIPAHLSKRDRLFATFVRSLAPLGPLLAASWGVLGRLKIVLGRLGGVLSASWARLSLLRVGMRGDAWACGRQKLARNGTFYFEHALATSRQGGAGGFLPFRVFPPVRTEA